MPNLNQFLYNMGGWTTDQRIERLRQSYLSQMRDTAKTAGIENEPDVQQVFRDFGGNDIIQNLQQGLTLSPKGEQLVQAIKNRAVAKAQGEKEQGQLADFRKEFETDVFGKPGGTLQDALTLPTSRLAQLSEALRGQETDIFQKNLMPVLRENLGAKGILEGGALQAMSSKELGELERGRQSRLIESALGAQGQLENLKYGDIQSNIGLARQTMAQNMESQRMAATMQYQDALERRRESLIQELQASSHGTDWGGIGSLLGAGAGIGLAALFPPAAGLTLGGAAMAGGLGSMLGGVAGRSFGGSASKDYSGLSAALMAGGQYGYGRGSGGWAPKQGSYWDNNYEQAVNNRFPLG